MRVLVRFFLIAAAIAHGFQAVPSAQTPMSHTATGTFDVKIKPAAADDYTDATSMGRMTIDKQYHGSLDGAARGQMLTGMSAEQKASGVYVAVEKFTGTLDGKAGSFMLHHTGLMNRGEQNLTIAIVPDSGTDQLKGIAGTMTIAIAKDGTHSYTLQYTVR